MVPPKKKIKVAASSEAVAEEGGGEKDAVMTDVVEASGGSGSGSGAGVVVEMELLDQLLDDFVDSLDNNDSSDSNQQQEETSSLTLLKVKDYQRSILKQLDTTTQILNSQYGIVEKHRTTLANLAYEQRHWESKIQYLKDSSKTPQLEALCREELDDNLSDRAKVITKFLKQDISDVDHNQRRVVAILHQQINARGTLERDLSQKNKEWINLSNIQKKRAQFLHQLPDKLKDMEKASLPLQRFFAAASRQQQQQQQQDGDDAGTPGLSKPKYNTTSERDTRLQLAHQLSGPLYTLFVQLQAYLDDYPQKSMTLDIGNVSSVVKNGGGTDATNNVWKDPDQHVVLWQIPIPDITTTNATPTMSTTTSSAATTKPKFMTIAFTYFDSYQLVTAKVVSGNHDDKLNVATVLQLNPQDIGEFRIQIHHEDEEKGGEKAAEPTTTRPIYGKPYLWCNYLAGLQILGDKPGATTTAGAGAASTKPAQLHSSSTRVIVAEVLRHLRSNATLHYILHRVLPSHPRVTALPPTNNNSSNNSSTAKVTTFQFVPPPDGSASTVRFYKVVIACKPSQQQRASANNNILSMMVQFDTALYPVLAPPIWSLTGNTLEWGRKYGSCESLALNTKEGDNNKEDGGSDANAKPPLHQSRLAAIEAKVNDIDGLIEAMKQGDGDGDNEKKEKDQEEENESYYYDWILTHQLREIMLEWEEWIITSSSSEGTNEKGGAGAAAVVRTVRGRDRAKVE